MKKQLKEGMECQEYYLLNSDGSFMKQREQEEIQTTARGDYSFIDNAGEKYLALNYYTNSEIIASCFADSSEILWLIADNKLRGSWAACDGSGLEYERVE